MQSKSAWHTLIECDYIDHQRAALAQVKQLSQRLRERLPRIGSLPPFEPEVDTVENKAGLMEEAKMKDGTSKTLVCKYVMQITYNIYVCLWILVLRSLCVEDCKDEGTKRAGHVDSSALDCYQDSVVVWFVCVKCSEFTWASREWTTATHMGPYIIICTQQEAAQGDVCCNWQSGLRGETGEHKGLYDTYLRRIYGFVLDWYITVIWNSSRYECRFIYIYILLYIYIYIYTCLCVYAKRNGALMCLAWFLWTFRVQWFHDAQSIMQTESRSTLRWAEVQPPPMDRLEEAVAS